MLDKKISDFRLEEVILPEIFIQIFVNFDYIYRKLKVLLKTTIYVFIAV